MKIVDMARQGDVLTVRIDCATDGLALRPREDGDVVLAHGEATGHKHRFRADTTHMREPWPEKAAPSARIEHARKLLASLPEIAVEAVAGILQLDAPDDLVHEEHSAIPHEAGTHAVIRQHQYTRGAVQIVAD